MKRYAVIGLSDFGLSMALELARLGQHVVAIDKDPEKVQDAQQHVAEALVTDATDAANLDAVGAGRVDVGVVSMGKDRLSAVLAVLHLSRFGVPEILAKATDPDHGEILVRVGATRIVYPEKEMAQRVAERLSYANILDYLALSPGFGVMDLAPTNRMIGKTLGELDFGRNYGVQVLAIREIVPDRVVIAPGAEQVIKDSDVLVVMGSDEAVERLRRA